jgi:hypothetical protein
LQEKGTLAAAALWLIQQRDSMNPSICLLRKLVGQRLYMTHEEKKLNEQNRFAFGLEQGNGEYILSTEFSALVQDQLPDLVEEVCFV